MIVGGGHCALLIVTINSAIDGMSWCVCLDSCRDEGGTPLVCTLSYCGKRGFCGRVA